jgi:hypothetical protein
MPAPFGAHKVSHQDFQAEGTISFEREENNENVKIPVHGPFCDLTACTCSSESAYFRTRH